MSQKQSSMRTPLGMVRGLGSAKSGTEHFWKQRVTAFANLFLIICFLVLVVNLADSSYIQAKEMVSNPVVSIFIIAAILSITTHMRIGMQVVIEDYVHKEGTRILALMANNFVTIGFAIAGVFAVIRLGITG